MDIGIIVSINLFLLEVGNKNKAPVVCFRAPSYTKVLTLSVEERTIVASWVLIKTLFLYISIVIIIKTTYALCLLLELSIIRIDRTRFYFFESNHRSAKVSKKH